MTKHWVGWMGVGLALVACSMTMPMTPQPSAGEQVGLPNPASVYCEEQGYVLEIRTDGEGSQYGVCLFPDGSECEEWAYYRGACMPASAQPATGEALMTFASFDHGFAFDYPASWSLAQAPQALKLTRGEALIYIAYKTSDEEWSIHWTGMPEGEWMTAGEVPFLGQMLTKTQLVLDGKVKVVTYQLPADTPSASGIDVRVRVDDRSPVAYADVEVGDGLQAETEAILASFHFFRE